MITRADVVDRVREWQLREGVVEKDYVLGWLLWGIGSDPRLSSGWSFKGGTCLKKCYIETYRFSEDLDFTVLPDGLIDPPELLPVLLDVLDRVSQESGIDFSVREPYLRPRPDGASLEGRIYYVGPLVAPVASIRLDLTMAEEVVRPTVLRVIDHQYPDQLPEPATIRCYSFEEVFAEKLRAMGQRSRPRDLYDIVNLFRRGEFLPHWELIGSVYREKCVSKGVEVIDFASLENSPFRAELESEWSNMLAHQLPALPPFQAFWEELPRLFDWLKGALPVPELPPVTTGPAEVDAWSPPATNWVWGQGVPLEAVRFAAANHLCVNLGYRGSIRQVEPYSLRRSRAGDLLLYGIRTDNSQIRSYSVDLITSVEVTSQPFTPRFKVEMTTSQPLVVLPVTRRTRGPRSFGYVGKPTRPRPGTTSAKRRRNAARARPKRSVSRRRRR